MTGETFSARLLLQFWTSLERDPQPIVQPNWTQTWRTVLCTSWQACQVQWTNLASFVANIQRGNLLCLGYSRNDVRSSWIAVVHDICVCIKRLIEEGFLGWHLRVLRHHTLESQQVWLHKYLMVKHTKMFTIGKWIQFTQWKRIFSCLECLPSLLTSLTK